MSYQCPKGHISTDSDYCSECGAKIGSSSGSSSFNSSPAEDPGKEEICPDCGTPRILNSRFCEVCRHDFIEGKTVTAEKIVAAQVEVKAEVEASEENPPIPADKDPIDSGGLDIVAKDEIIIGEKLNIIISVDKNKLSQTLLESGIRPDTMDRIFPLDLDENLVGRRSIAKGIYPEIEVNDPGVSHRHLKFIKGSDGAFSVLELGSTNGTELNGVRLEPGINTSIKSGDEFAIGLWTILKVVSR